MVLAAAARKEIEHGDAEREAAHRVETEYDDRLRQRLDFFREPVERGIDELEDFRGKRLIAGDGVVEVGRGSVRAVHDLDDFLDNLRQSGYVLEAVYYFLNSFFFHKPFWLLMPLRFIAHFLRFPLCAYIPHGLC